MNELVEKKIQQTLRNENTQKSDELAKGDISFHAYITAATSDNTRKAYRSDIRHFINWGGVLPTTSDVIISYLQSHAKELN